VDHGAAHPISVVHTHDIDRLRRCHRFVDRAHVAANRAETSVGIFE